MRRVLTALLVLVCLSLVSVTFADAQTNTHKQTNLASEAHGTAPVIDSHLVNTWGICIIPDDPLRIEPTGQTADPHPTNVTAGLDNEMPALRGTTTLMVTGTSGNLTHSASVTRIVQ
jgi:hypothetical protein